MSTPTLETKERSEILRARRAKAKQAFEAAHREVKAAQEALWDNTTTFIEIVRSIRPALTSLLQRGGEKRLIVENIEGYLSIGESIQADLSDTRSYFEDAATLATIDSYIQETGDVVAWIRGLAQQASKKAPPLDESKLPPDPGCAPPAQAEGFISIAEARAKLSR